ncbi:MAG: glycosyltransferase family 2 protein [Deltaproteobacteria bacterium]|nr:glycosyltransferase family 2 protein [Deltaproteobacteria bacterium]
MNSPPVLFLIFNRPELTHRVFACIRAARPAQLFVAADGPRNDRPHEAEICEQTRKIIEAVDWDCDIATLFREKNLGCKKAVSTAIDWFFEHVEEGIILEDDCLPNPSFFQYCQELLEHYRKDSRVMQICGLNVLQEWRRCGYSYYFSSYGPIWGWASWQRAWHYYDVDMKLWPEIKQEKLYEDFCQNQDEATYRLNLYNDVYSGKIDTWDYQWGFAKMINNGLSVIPSVNLISNIGFTADGTHTVADKNNPYAAMATYTLPSPLNHPQHMIRDFQADQRYINDFMSIKPGQRTIKQRLLKFLHKAKNEK